MNRSRRMGPGPPGRAPVRDQVVAGVMAVLLVALFVTGVYFYREEFAGLGGGASPALAPVNTTLNLSMASAGTIGEDFLGLNLRADESGSPSLLSTGPLQDLHLVRWPGGNLAERYDMTANGGNGVIYNANGSTSVPALSAPAFVSWCEKRACQAVLTVPAEIDNASHAAYLVAYVEKGLGFHPAYWEIGNEPGLWTHFAVPWTEWSSLQQLGVSPEGYAAEVQAYESAMRAVDPSIRIVGLGGVGTGNVGEETWIQDLVRVNGPNLSAVSIHVYPAGAGTPGETDAQVYASLEGTEGLLNRVPRDEAAIRAACPSCNLALLVDEFNAATGTTLSPFLSGFPLVPYVAAEVIQGLELNVTSMDLWVLQGGYAGSLFDPAGDPRPVYSLYAHLLDRLDPAVHVVSMAPELPDLAAIATENTSGPNGTTLLVANLNTSHGVTVMLGGSGFPFTAPATLTLWDGAMTAPSMETFVQGDNTWTLPPESVALWTVAGPIGYAPA